MTRRLKSWLPAYLAYTEGTEAPRMMHFWSGVAAIAGALRRKVWIDMRRFQWTPNFYIIFVAPPGIVSKTTTMGLSIDLLKQVPGIKFGPDVVTWQALATRFAEIGESFQYGEDWIPMSPMTLASGELGNLIDPQDRNMINFYISMWDGLTTFEKVTKGSGQDMVECPWINMIGCTTPHWIADNMPAATVGGGFTSRCVFVYADKKENFVAYPDEAVRASYDQDRLDLIADLEHIATNLVGPYKITESARIWGRAWYEELWTKKVDAMGDKQLNGYMARKQTHLHKLAMVLSASRTDLLEIDIEDLVLADKMLAAVEPDLDKVFSRIGRSEDSLQAERFVDFIRRYGKVPYAKAYQHIHNYFPNFHDFEGILAGCIRSGVVKMEFHGLPKIGPDGKPMQDAFLIYCGD